MCASRALHHHGGGLDDGGRRHARLERQLLDRVRRHDRDHAGRLVDEELDLGDQPFDPDVGNRAPEPVPCAEADGALALEPVDLLQRDDPAVAAVAGRLDPPGTVPAAQGVEADAEPPGRFAGAVELPWHYLDTKALPRRRRSYIVTTMAFLDSYRRRRRLKIAAVVVAVAVPSIFFGVHYSTPGSAENANGPYVNNDEYYRQPKHVPFRAADRHAARKVLARFVSTAVARCDVGQSWDLAGPT